MSRLSRQADIRPVEEGDATGANHATLGRRDTGAIPDVAEPFHARLPMQTWCGSPALRSFTTMPF
jgi:hypothetical protein